MVRISAGEESSTNAPASRDLNVNLDEANVTLLTLPLGTTARFGLMRPRFGTLNTVHQDDLPQVDRPDVLTQFFGPEEMDGESGLEAFWVLPLSNYNELSVGIFNGDNEVAFGRGSLRKPLVMGRWRSSSNSRSMADCSSTSRPPAGSPPTTSATRWWASGPSTNGRAAAAASRSSRSPAKPWPAFAT